MSGKPKDYLWAFIIGGLLSVLTQVILTVLRGLGIDPGVCITIALGIMALFGFVMTVLGIYGKWEGLGGLGAILPFSGLISGIIGITSAQLSEGKDLKTAALTGMRGSAQIFGIGSLFCMLLAVIVRLVS